ncbi:MFS transporter [Salegentibacter sp. JZCK2]|uniref:MFS transporter n=1 Tax=Salegentibacter tibetensis TaxID=2873600 RepID=UPI001CCF9B6D|nr:MFS transporter [Salegentibacter tibetensis]MBZ9729378.1 MFS transporter [Salegentibacter tibetensis]
MKTENQQRIALSTYFFLSGFCFSTWASRIPNIKMAFDLNEAELGNLLMVMPISSLIGLPVSGWLVSRFESRFPLIVSFVLLAASLSIIGIADSLFLLITGIFAFAFSMRIFNIAMNTQSLTLQKNFKRKIIGSFHGLWSTGGLLGVAFSTLLIKFDVPIYQHLPAVAIFTFILALIAFKSLLKKDRSTQGNKLRFGKPDKPTMYLGFIVFLAAITEGGMFDWSGVYFKEVVNEDIFTLGYLIFMVFMALSRFFSDRIVERIGMEKNYIISASLVCFGVLLMVIFPYFWPALIGFCLVGIGVAAVIPMTFLLAGSSEKYSPGMAISIITTYAIVGMLLGPPLVGYLAHLFNLKVSFILFFISALMLIPISQLFFKKQKENAQQ